MDFFSLVLASFIPLFVAIGVFGVVPIFISMTEGVATADRRSLVTQATFTALVISMCFVFLGKEIFLFLGITAADFRVGGGMVLLVLSISDLISSTEPRRRAPSKQLGVVPIGIPLIIGPGALTTLILSVDSHGVLVTTSALALNLVIVWVVFRYSDLVIQGLGDGGAKALAKVSSLLLCAIAVMMMRTGITNYFETFHK